MLEIFIDADGCPVKQEAFRVAQRYGLRVTVVANLRIHIPNGDWVKLVVVEGQFDAADDWIVEHITGKDVVVTADVPLASRCIKKGARVLDPNGRVLTEETIGEALSHRDIMTFLRDTGNMTGGSPPYHKQDRSRFLQRLDDLIQAIRREK